MNGFIRHVFPGGNTSIGFYSLYKYIISQDEARRIIVIKGGPGTGKSSLMKNIGRHFSEKNFDIEFHHCSSDNNSLDGVLIKGLNAALIDGTSPHVVDPINPGAVDEILNMGDCWNEEGFSKCRKNIIEINHEIGNTFKRSYKFLGAAKCIHEDWTNCNQEALNISGLNKLKEDIKDKIFTNPVTQMGAGRHLFATAFTPDGIVTFIDNLLTGYDNIYVLNGGPGTGKSSVLEYISDEALKRGYFVEVFHDPFIPSRLEHIPELNFALVTSNEINQKALPGIQINMDDLIIKDKRVNLKNQIEEDKGTFYELTSKALNVISSAKGLHDKMETYYIENMDFNKVNEKVNYVTEKLESYAESYTSNI
jgi:DNA replication protein DnaC